MSVATGLAVLGAGGTAVAAGTGNLPAGLQQHAHRLFSALGVPAPRTGTTTAPEPTGSASAASPTPAPSPTPAATGTAVPSAVPSAAQVVAWCRAWQTAQSGGKPMNGRARRDLIAAAGGVDDLAGYCAHAGVSAAPATSATTPGAGTSQRATPSHPTPHATTPSHPGP